MEAERDRIHAESKEAHAAVLEKEVNTTKKLREELQEAQKNADEQEQRLKDQVNNGLGHFTTVDSLTLVSCKDW